MSRPQLPVRHANPHIQTMEFGELPPVKYQILTCQGKDILVGRMKIETPTPSGHAFILRRFDTGAVSLTTMFRAAFPTCGDEEEKREVAWVKTNYDLSGYNGSTKEPHITRLAGTWVSPEIALELGKLYSLSKIIAVVVEAQPDPDGNYRRSGKAVASKPSTPATVTTTTVTTTVTQSPAKTLPTPSPTSTLPNPAKRRKESSPVPPASSASSIQSSAPARSATPRRSTRTRSPTPRTGKPLQSLTATAKAIKPKSTRREQVATPGGSDETIVDEESIDDVAGSELRQQDVAEQKALIQNLKDQRDQVSRGEGEAPVANGAANPKRAREEEAVPVQFNPKEPEVGDRTIATNRRVNSFQLEPQQKSFAWGVAAFAFGLGAVTFLPNFF